MIGSHAKRNGWTYWHLWGAVAMAIAAVAATFEVWHDIVKVGLSVTKRQAMRCASASGSGLAGLGKAAAFPAMRPRGQAGRDGNFGGGLKLWLVVGVPPRYAYALKCTEERSLSWWGRCCPSWASDVLVKIPARIRGAGVHDSGGRTATATDRSPHGVGDGT